MKNIVLKMEKRVCNICNIEKYKSEFYTNRAHCKTCHNHCEYKLELYKCEVCNITIRKVKKKKHDKSKRHQKCLFFNEQIDENRLQKQNRRIIGVNSEDPKIDVNNTGAIINE